MDANTECHCVKLFITRLRLCFVNTFLTILVCLVLLAASERVIPTCFGLILLPLPDLVSQKEFGLE